MNNPTEALFTSLHEFMAAAMSDSKAASLSVGISQGVNTVFEHSVGYADIEKQIRSSVETPYSIASITKPMIGTLLAWLAEQGRIDLTQPVNRYIGAGKVKTWEGLEDDVTVARLANHTAGLPMYFQFFFDDEDARPPGYEETIRRYGNVMRPPGERYVYSNIGYGILGHLVEVQTGRSLEAVCRDVLFGGLGMNTAMFAPLGSDIGRYAIRYDQEGKALPHYVTDHPAASEAYASVRDLLKFGGSHIGKTRSAVLDIQSIAEMQKPQGPLRTEQGYGLGWAIGRTASGERFFAHSGGMDGVSTRLTVLPEQELVVTVLCNSADSIVSDTMRKIWEILDVRFAEDPKPLGPQPAPSGSVRSWTGAVETYAGDISLALEIGKDGKVSAQVNGVDSESEAVFEDGVFQGAVKAQLNTGDAIRNPHELQLDLTYRGDTITGFVRARSTHPTRIGNALSYPARLNHV